MKRVWNRQNKAKHGKSKRTDVKTWQVKGNVKKGEKRHTPRMKEAYIFLTCLCRRFFPGGPAVFEGIVFAEDILKSCDSIGSKDWIENAIVNASPS